MRAMRVGRVPAVFSTCVLAAVAGCGPGSFSDLHAPDATRANDGGVDVASAMDAVESWVDGATDSPTVVVDATVDARMTDPPDLTPPCTPDCGSRQCGWDPVCGTVLCGTCSQTTACNFATGSCASRVNLLLNASFESGNGSVSTDWSQGWWQPGAAYGRESGASCRSGSCATIEISGTANDAYLEQPVALTPRFPYNLMGWVRGDAIAGAGSTIGASIGKRDSFTFAGGPLGTSGWQLVEVTFEGPPSGSTPIAARLGYFSNAVTGKAWFDDLFLTGDDFALLTGSHVTLELEKDDLLTVPAWATDRWLRHLDDYYGALTDLVGGTPYGGESIRVLSVRQYAGGWAVAGNPIGWTRAYVVSELADISAHDNWSFGITHEIGHDFDLDYKWVWHGEFFANFKMYYGIMTLGGRVRLRGVNYDGANLRNYYLLRQGEEPLGWDAMTYRFIVISEAIGWSPFQQTFRYFSGLPTASVPATRNGKFDLFIQKLGDFSGVDVRALFTSQELAWIANDLQ